MGKKMNRILFLTCRNIINTCGELRLVKNRAQVLFQKYDIATDFMVFTHKLASSPETIDAGGELTIYKYDLYNAFQKNVIFAKFCNEVQNKLKSQDYDMVIISGAQLLELVDIIRNVSKSILLLADIHGAYEELLEFPGTNLLVTQARHMLYTKVKKLEKKYLPRVDYLLAVSNGLKSYLVKEYNIDEDKIHIVPCSVHKTVLDYNEYFQNRKSAREKYNIRDDELLFIYSGGVSKWQCIEESVEIFKSINKSLKYKAKLLMLSGDKKYISRFEGDDIIVDSLKSNEVPSVLPAGDFAFLLRKDYITNRVAYPNKYLEYIIAGLNVITTPFVEDVAESVSSNDLGYVLQDACMEKGLLDYIKIVRNKDNDFVKRQKLLDNVCFENRLRFVKQLLLEK